MKLHAWQKYKSTAGVPLLDQSQSGSDRYGAELPLEDPKIEVPGNNGNSAVDRGGSYLGGKGGTGVWQTIINQIPRCVRLIEPFAGSATIARKIKPPQSIVLIDSNPAVCQVLNGRFAGVAGTHVINACGISWLIEHASQLNKSTVVYADPPFLKETRSRYQSHQYEREMSAPLFHRDLLAVLSRLDCHVLLSGYPSALYEELIPKWRRIDYRGQTRGGRKLECLWCNFEEPERLHDDRFIGRTHRQRTDFKRKTKRWVTKFLELSRPHQAAMLKALQDAGRFTEPTL